MKPTPPSGAWALAGLRAQEQRAFLLASPSRLAPKARFGRSGVLSGTRLAFVLLDRCGAAPDSHRIPFFTGWGSKAPRCGTKGNRKILWFTFIGQPISWGAHHFSAPSRRRPDPREGTELSYSESRGRAASAAAIMPRDKAAHSSGEAPSAGARAGRIRTRTWRPCPTCRAPFLWIS